jgi:glyoxylase-like metal-dependent hydrolase (beta-lactamase superfamily II)
MSAMDGLEETAASAAHDPQEPVRPKLTYPCGDPPEPGTIKQVAPGVHWVRMPLPFALQWINLWLIEDGDGFALVDTGVATEQTREHWRQIFTEGLGGKPITKLICTHMHPDHIGLAGWITRKFNAPLLISRLEYVTCRMLVADTGREAPEDGVRFYRAAGWGEDALDSYRIRFGGFGKAVSRMPDSFVRLSDGDTITLGGRPWRIITGNGHSPEHVCLFQPDLNLLISGDQVLPRISSNVSVFPTEPDADPLADWLSSCAKLKNALPADCLVLPAHNEPFIGLHDRLTHLIASHERGLARLMKRLTESDRRVVDLFGAMFARQIGPDLLGMATGETLAHLNCLLARGHAVKTMSPEGVALYRAYTPA